MSKVLEEDIEEVILDQEEEEETQIEEEQEETEESQVEEDEAEDKQEEDEEDSLQVTIGDDEPDQEENRAPKWVKQLRKDNRKKDQKIRELESRLQVNSPQPKKLELGQKPTLASSDFEEDVYEQNLVQWFERKRQIESQEEQAKQVEQQKNEAWQKKLNDYNEKKTSLKTNGFDEAEEIALESLTDTQQGIILQGAENPALLVYALGTNEKRLKELAKIDDHVKFAFEVARLEKDLKVNPRKKTPPAPERKVSGSAKSSNQMDSEIDRIREKAYKTGNFSELQAYKRKHNL